MAPEHSYLLSGSLPTPKPPKWMGGTHPEDLDELPHEIPTLVDDALVDVSQPLHVDEEGRLICGGTEVHPCCLEAVTWGHADCDTSQFIHLPNGAGRQRQPIPVKPNWRTDGQ